MIATRANMKKIENAGIRAMQFCKECFGEYSASSGDYFLYSDDYVFKCCDEPCQLVTKQTVIQEVTV